MTLRTRNKVLITTFVCAFLTIAGLSWTVWLVYNQTSSAIFSSTTWGPLFLKDLRMFSIFNLAFASGLIIVSLFAYSYFRKTSSPEFFFFLITVLAFLFESSKSFQLLTVFFNHPAYIDVIITRAVLFFRATGLLSLFLASLYTTGFNYQKSEIILGILLLIAVSFANAIPVDMTTRNSNLLLNIAINNEITIVTFAILIFSVINFLLGSFINNNRDYFYLGIGALLFSVGYMGTFISFGFYLWIVAGAACTLGSWLIFFKIHKIYLWM